MSRRRLLAQNRRMAVLAMLAIALPMPAWSADASDHLNTRQPERPAFLAPSADPPFRLPEVPGTSLLPDKADDETVFVAHIVFRGNRAISTPELAALAAPYAGQRLGEAALEALRQELTHHYIAQGYINSGALLGENALSGDTLTIDIVEGRLLGIRLSGLDGLNERYVSGRLQGDPAAALNVDVLRERFALLVGDPLFKRLDARLIPGEQRGEALLDIAVERELPYRLTAYANNHRPPSIGSNLLGLSGSLANLSGHGDLLEASLQTPPQDSTSLRGSLAWRLPLNPRGSVLTLQYERSQSAVVEAPMEALNIRSVLDSREIGISQTVFESLQQRLTLGLGNVRRENRSSLLGQPFSFVAGEPDGVTRITAWRFWQDYSYRSQNQVLALRSTFSTARNNLLSPEQNAVPEPVAQPQGHYDLWLGQAQWARQVMDNGAQLVLRGSVQKTAQQLMALDRMSIGGNSTVRGYRENQLLRDRGVIFNVEFDYPLLKAADPGLNLSLIPFYDTARGRNLKEAADTLASAGIAARLRWQGFSLDLAVARRLQHPDAITRNGGTWQDRGVHCQLSYRFY